MKTSSSKSWQIQLIFTWITIFTLLIGSFFLPITNSLWLKIDERSFYFLNNWISSSAFWQGFWAIANHPLADWFEDLVIITFFISYIKSGSGPTERLRRVAHFFILALTLAVTIKFINQGFFRYIVYLGRESPSIVMKPLTLLTDHIDWMKIKCRSHSSFPSDHATTALFFTGYYSIVCDRKPYRILAVLYGIFLCLPRMVIGAHWLTDVLLGSGAIVTVILSLLFLTPLHTTLERFFTFLFSLKKIWIRE